MVSGCPLILVSHWPLSHLKVATPVTIVLSKALRHRYDSTLNTILKSINQQTLISLSSSPVLERWLIVDNIDTDQQFLSLQIVAHLDIPKV